MTTMQEIQAVATANKQQQMKARDLNTRAGAETFKVWTLSELEDWLKVRTNGAVNATTVLDVSALTLPALDEAQVAEVLTMNPDEVEIAGQLVKVAYSKDYYGSNYTAKVSLDSPTVLSLQATPTLPSGRALTMVTTYEGKSFELNDLVQIKAQIEARRIEKAWEVARGKHATDWQNDLNKTLDRLSSVLTKVEITADTNGQPIEAFIALQQYDSSGSCFKLSLETESEAKNKTQAALQALVRRSLKDLTAIAQEEPFQKKSTDWYSSWSLTDLGEGLKARFEHIMAEASASEGLTIETVSTRIEEAKVKVQKARSEIGGRYIEVRDKVVAAETAFKAAYEAIDYYDRKLVEAEIEGVQAQLKTAREQLVAANYDETEATIAPLASRVEALKVEVETKKAEKKQAKERKEELDSKLYDLRYGRGDYREASDEEKAEADRLTNELYNLVESKGDYAQALILAIEAETFINKIDSRIAAWRELENKLAEFLLPDYENNGWSEVGQIHFDSNRYVYYGDPGFDVLMDALIELPEGEEILALMETELDNNWLVRLEAKRYGRDEIGLTFRLNREVVVKEKDFERTKTVDLYQEPTEAELTTRQQIRHLENQLKQLEAESQRYGRILVKFEADPRPEFKGRLTGLVTVENVSIKLPKQDEYTTVEGIIRVTCDPARCNWLDVPPAANESWYCTYKDFAIGRDKQGRLVVPVNPQTKQVDPATIRAEIERLKRGETTTTEQQGEAVNPEALSSTNQEAEAVKASEDFKVLGDGYVRCVPCNYSNQPKTKKEWKALTSGTQVPVTCSQCGRIGHVQK